MCKIRVLYAHCEYFGYNFAPKRRTNWIWLCSERFSSIYRMINKTLFHSGHNFRPFHSYGYSFDRYWKTLSENFIRVVLLERVTTSITPNRGFACMDTMWMPNHTIHLAKHRKYFMQNTHQALKVSLLFFFSFIHPFSIIMEYSIKCCTWKKKPAQQH